MSINKKRFLNHVLSSRDFILDLIFPIECLGCGTEGVWLCKDCFRQLPIRTKQYCLNCKKPNEFGEFCPDCAPAYALDGVWIAGDYENKIIASLIKNLKYHFARDLAEILGQFLILFLRNLINKGRIGKTDLGIGINEEKIEKIKKTPEIIFDFKNCLLIPVPLHKKRERWRGFNQVLAIAKTIATHFNLELSTGLIRLKHRPPQAKLSEAKRKRNLRNCFAWTGASLANRRVILVDDVVTTGSTLNECAKILKQAGASEVWGLVAAKG
ncbi:MAG: ComF family protein [Patescibacteria group bacterium]|nr:ComF family protein [Patescibacteria group bacterium]MDD5295057.1 ComF family protein [Patescibacteria group bacterium]MDD5555031.1 ComF family protein [Patescibacteria group bacterium]